MRKVLLSVVLTFLFFTCFAGTKEVAGRWITIDDDTGKKRSIVKLWVEKGELKGRIVEFFPSKGEEKNPLCDKCEGKDKNKPIIGLDIIWGLKKDGEVWEGGEVRDPKDGKVYRCKIELDENGKKLNIRGYIGFSLFGRTQTWIRENK